MLKYYHSQFVCIAIAIDSDSCKMGGGEEYLFLTLVPLTEKYL